MIHHPSCREDHEGIENLLKQLPPSAEVAAVWAQMSIANRLAAIEDLLGSLAANGDPMGRLAAQVEAESHGGSQ